MLELPMLPVAPAPNHATPDDIDERFHMDSFIGVSCISIMRILYDAIFKDPYINLSAFNDKSSYYTNAADARLACNGDFTAAWVCLINDNCTIYYIVTNKKLHYNIMLLFKNNGFVTGEVVEVIDDNIIFTIWANMPKNMDKYLKYYC